MSTARSAVPFFMSSSSVVTTPVSQAHFGHRPLQSPAVPAQDHLEVDGVSWTGIRDVDGMPPFFTTSVGDNDAWLYAGSNGALCGGRRDPDSSVFPYVTVDRILDHPRSAGPLSVFLITLPGEEPRLWEPWSELPAVHARRRSLYKHPEGNGLCFVEADLESGLVFRAVISSCAPYGLVRECRLSHTGQVPVSVTCLDGWHRLVPPGVGTAIWKNFSYLAQAYMRHDRVPGIPLGVYTLNAAITDRAEAMEVQRAAVAWSVGLPADARVLLSTRQVEAFRIGQDLRDETEIRGETGAFLSEFAVSLNPGAQFEWLVGLDTNLDHVAVLRLKEGLQNPETFRSEVKAALASDRASLRLRLASADGLEKSADAVGDEHHLSNTLFNIMRGGSLPPRLNVDRDAFLSWLRIRNRTVAGRHEKAVSAWPIQVRLDELRTLAAATGDAQLERLAGIYLPLSFSRRHGDPSRPWNYFSIRLTNEEGKPLVSWQGNWRDIFQNWEALALSFPTALPGMISSFLDASSADGYNPYRITSEGVDWEVPEPDNPWAHFGYWGDHQIVYLQRLLALAENYFPGWLTGQLARRVHVCVDIPYRIAGFEDLLKDPRDTVHFSKEHHSSALQREKQLGTDGRLQLDAEGEPLLFSMAEKLLIPVIAKLSNWVPGGGIWLSTQRPEWNDANNALVGYGLSMVTVSQLRKHLELLLTAFAGATDVPFSEATSGLLKALTHILEKAAAKTTWSPEERLGVMRELGVAAEAHRARVYQRQFGAFGPLEVSWVKRLLLAGRAVLDATIRANQRTDGLYHSYNLLELSSGGAGVAHLQLMLEGQVAVLGSGCLSGAEALVMLQQLRKSALYRADQNSYILYPNRVLKSFLERNTFPAARLEGSALLAALDERRNRSLVVRDHLGKLHFAADLGNLNELEQALQRLAKDPALAPLVDAERPTFLAIWEETFEHKSFLGRSGTMFGFEGLGCIYWHMVSKLLLSVQEVHQGARLRGESPEVIAGLAAAYYDVRQGLGPGKTPFQFGAFPTDPYSHTPGHRGAQQPGMTGQVKEELLARRGELGVRVTEGRLAFAPTLLRRSEFLPTSTSFAPVTLDGTVSTLEVPAGGLAFSVCQVPVVYRLGGEPSVVVVRNDGEKTRVSGLALSAELSSFLFRREGSVHHLEVNLGAPVLL